jgi:hypothetical protein
MKTFAVLVFIAGVAAAAIFLARKSTVADGRVLEAELVALTRVQGVIAMACDREIPIGRRGAVFMCTATLKDGGTQLLECTIDRSSRITWKPVSGVMRNGITTSGDPWGSRP